MIAREKKNNEMKFCGIESGGTFKYENDIFIKLAYETVTEYVNAINIENGEGVYFENDDMIVRLVGEFIYTEVSEVMKGNK